MLGAFEAGRYRPQGATCFELEFGLAIASRKPLEDDT